MPQEIIYSLLFPIAANVAAYFICKWLDRKFEE